MASHPDPLELIQETLPPAPRPVPPEMATLLEELAAGVLPPCWGMAAVLLVVGAMFLPGALLWAQLDLRGVDARARIVGSTPVIAFPFRRLHELKVSFLDESGNEIHASSSQDAQDGTEPLRGGVVSVCYDPYDPRSLRLEGQPNPKTWLAGLWGGALLLPLLGRAWAWLLGRRRRLAFTRGTPIVAKVQGYTRILGIHHLDLKFRHNDRPRETLEPIAPIEVDRYSALSTVAALLHVSRSGKHYTCTLGELEGDQG